MILPKAVALEPVQFPFAHRPDPVDRLDEQDSLLFARREQREVH